MRSLPGTLGGVFLLLSAVALALSCSPAIPRYEFKYAEKRATLPNGLRLVVIPDASTPMVQVDVRYQVGSNEDPPGKAGLAHLVEHMMFQHRLLGPDKPATFEILPQIAVDFNAYTIFDKTHYYLVARKEDLESLLRLEAARMGAGCQNIPPEQFEREREVVRNEIRQRTGTPEGQVFQLLLDAIYPRGHAYNQMVGGNDVQLSSITFQDVCDFMAGYYTPDRATLVVTGNVEPEQVGKLVSFAFGGIEKRIPAPRTPVAPLAELEHKKIVHKVDVERTQVHVLWKLPPKASDEWPAARAMMAIMAGRVAMFADQWDVAASVSASPFGGDLAPVYALSLELNDPDDVDAALGYVWKATGSLHRGFEEGSFDHDFKAVAKASFITGLESLAARADMVADLVQFPSTFAFHSSDEYLIAELKKIDGLDGGKFRQFIKGTLRKENAVVVVMEADKKGLKGDRRSGLKFTARSHDKEMTPILDPREASRPLAAPRTLSILRTAERYTLGNGMEVVLLPKRDGMPVVTAELIFNVGSTHEPPYMAGLAEVAAGYLRPARGANFMQVGIELGSSVDDDHTAFFARGVEIYLEPIIKGLERTIKAGEYDQESLERWQKYQRLRMDTQRYRDSVAFNQTMAAALYGPDHPYTATGTPTRDSVGRIGYDEVTRFQRKHYSARNATLIVVGKFDAKRAKSIIAASFGDWNGGHQDTPAAAANRQRQGPEYFAVVGRENPQMQVTIAYPAPAGMDAQHAARMVLARMLDLRMARIRTELGSTYGTYARHSMSVGPGAYVMGGSVDATRAGESLAAMRSGIDSLRRGDDFDLDFVRARRVVLRQLLAESTETMALASRLASIAAHDLAGDHHDKLVQRVAVVSTAQVKALLATELDPQLEIIGAMADRATLTRAFDEAGISTVRYVEDH